MKKEEVKSAVKERYGKIAVENSSCCPATSFSCGGIGTAEDASKKIGYTDEELRTVPQGSNLGLGCGNPTAIASLREGETVLDLGSGAGFDCFLAAEKVGENGKIIGVDMTLEMVEKAKENARQGNYANVDFRLGEIENLPVEDNSVDAVISNCVINLSPDKGKVFGEAFRVLKPGGRMIVSDLVLLEELPYVIKKSVEAYKGCISGAITKDEYVKKIEAAGFEGVEIVEETHFPVEQVVQNSFLRAAIGNLKKLSKTVRKAVGSVVSVKVYGVKPASVRLQETM